MRPLGHLALLLGWLCCWPPAALAHEERPADAAPSVGVAERLGQYIPEDVVLADEAGRPVNLRQILTLPTILVPVYYACPNACNLLLGRLAQVLPQVGLSAGRDYQVVTVSFDERETPELARRKHRDFSTALAGRFPPQHWRFLTGDQDNIGLLMAAIGFAFQRQGEGFQHPMVLVALSPSGKITRYLHGGSPLPFDIAMAAVEAASERPGLSVTRALAFCYTYDPQGQRYVFNLMRVAGAAVLLGVLVFAAFLWAGARQRRRRQAAAPERKAP
ncbi:MAG: SCO family protein [Desulfarculus sp.]|nr:SCO family protein [Desulfarculus sp.]